MPFFSDNRQIDTLVDQLPQKNLTVRALQTLDFAAPGEWKNTASFDELVTEITGSTDPTQLAQIRNRANELFADDECGFGSAFRVFQRVDDFDKILGSVALVDKLGSKVQMLGFLEKVTPKADTVQAIDLAVKVVSELLAYVRLNGVPRSVEDFTAVLGEYDGAAKIRLAGLIAFDGIIPLGPDFIDRCNDGVCKLNENGLEQNSTFQRIKQYLPEGIRSVDFIELVFNAVSGRLGDFVAKTGMSREMVIDKLKDYVDVSDDKLDYLGAFLDISTNFYEHTGVQTVATKVIKKAASEV